MKIKLSTLNKKEIFNGCINRYEKNDYTKENYNNKELLFGLFDKAYNEVKNYVLDNTQGGKSEIKNKKETVSILSGGYYHDSYNKQEIYDYFGVHEVFCVMIRLYNISKN